MADFHLTPDSPLTLPSRRVKVHVTAIRPAGAFDLSLQSENRGFPPAYPLTDRQWLVQMVTVGNTDPVTLRLIPRGNSTFPSGARFEITMQFVGDEESPATDIVHLTTRDASGLDMLDAVEFAPVGVAAVPGVRMTVPSDDATPRHLSTQAQASFTVARRVLGVDRLPASEALQVTVLVDGSASMSSFCRSGLVGDLIEVLRGLSAVVAPPAGFTVYVADEAAIKVSAEDPEWGEAVTVALHDRGARVGFRSARPELVQVNGQRSVTYVVTDGIPADLFDLTAAGAKNHVVMVCSQAALRAWAPDPDLSLTVWDPAVRYIREPELSVLVTSLLDGCMDHESQLMRG
jgi:hypothetical protein